jgi:hypothetical protein
MSERKVVLVSRDELESAFLQISMSEQFECSAWINIANGKVSVRSPYTDGDEDAGEEDDDESEGVIPIPDKKELGLGRPLVMRFGSELMPDDYDTIDGFFHRRGAYSRFKDFPHRRDMLQRWYEYEERATDEALAEWCEENGIQLVDDRPRNDDEQRAEE